MVRDFYDVQGFDKLLEDESGNSEWLLDLKCEYKARNEVININ